MESETVGVSKVTSYKALFTQKEYMKLMLANVVNRFGDSIDAVAYSWLMYEITQSASLMALIVGLNFVPTILLQPIAGAWVENRSKKKIMAIFDIVRGVIVALCVALYLMKALTPAILIALTIATSAAESLRVPAGGAIVPKILAPEYYDVGTGLNQTASRVTEIVGLAAAGGVVALLGCEGALLIDAATFFISAVIIMMIKVTENVDKARANIKGIWEDFKDGFSLLKKSKTVILLICIGALINFAVIPLNAYSAAFIADCMHGTAEMLSIINILMCCGMALGAFFAPKMKRMSGQMKIVVFGVITGLAMGSFGIASYIESVLLGRGLLYVASFIMGIAVGVINVVFSSAFMKLVPAEYMGRMSGIMNALLCCAMPVGSFICSALAATVPIAVAIIVAAGFSVLMFLCVTRAKSLKEI